MNRHATMKTTKHNKHKTCSNHTFQNAKDFKNSLPVQVVLSTDLSKEIVIIVSNLIFY